MTPNPPPDSPNRPRWPWIALGLGLTWTAAIRVPLILRARAHLDSDLAVDGLTLLDALRGHWRWHYPGTPHMGTPPVLLSYPQALILGPTPEVLVAGGVVAWLLVVLAVFWLAWRAFGPSVASWAIVPLVFSTVGTVWLSGRITGGHLLTLAWHAAAFAGLAAILGRGGAWRSALLGLWCGLGLYLDTMFAFTLAGLIPAALLSWRSAGRPRSGIVAATAFAAALAIGAAPREIGRRVEPHDAYNEQFAPIFRPEVLAEHARILAMECLPRLIAGYELPDLRATPEALAEGGRPVRLPVDRVSVHPHAPFAVAFTLGLFAASIARLAVEARKAGGPGGTVALGTLISAGLIAIGFMINRNIFNSDNYRYLIFLLVPWAIGFGLLMRSVARRGALGRASAIALAAVLAASMTASLAAWSIDLGWVDDRLVPRPIPTDRWPHQFWGDLTVPVRSPGGAVVGRDLYRIPPEATHIYGDYWDVYRIAFLSGGAVVGVPFPTYPNRFEGWSEGLGPDEGALVVLDPAPGWRAMLAESWRREGRDPAELDRITIINP